MYNLTAEQLNELVCFANDDRMTIPTESLEALNSLYAAVQRNTLRHLTGIRKRNQMLTERIARYQERKEEAIQAGEFRESGRDSLDVATALLYQLQQLKTYKLNKFKLIAILYEMYASWLYSKKERLFIEHPVATEFGPRFWRVYNRIPINEIITLQTWNIFAQNNPDVAAYCINAAKKYYDYTEGTLTRMYMSSKAYKNASKENNNGKWNKEIADNDIYNWKATQKKEKP